MKVLVTGGRFYHGRAEVFAALDRLRPSRIAHGHAKRGTDRWADEWAVERGVTVCRYPANWTSTFAGLLRNSEMLEDFQPDLVLATEGGAGTADMVGKANKAGVPVEFV